MRQKVVSSQEVVKTAEEYSRVAAGVCPNITVLHITKEDIEGCCHLLDSLVFDASKTLPGTWRMHHMEVVGPSQVKHSQFKGANVMKIHNFK